MPDTRFQKPDSIRIRDTNNKYSERLASGIWRPTSSLQYYQLPLTVTTTFLPGALMLEANTL